MSAKQLSCYGIAWSMPIDGGQELADKVINIIYNLLIVQ